jgi:hypothetical protein
MPAQEKEIYTAADCSETAYTAPISNKVIVVSRAVLPNDLPGQLFCCTGEGVTNPHVIDKTVFAVSLSTGEHHRFGRSDVIGTLKPELLPDEAKLCFSQIRPEGADDVNAPEYSGYCYLKDGRYSTGVQLRDAKEAAAYMRMQAAYQNRVRLCDRDDFTVAETTEGRLIHPSREEWAAFRQGGAQPEQKGGMTMI